MLKRAAAWLEASNRFGWILLVILLPITSLPLVSSLAHSDSVAPASVLPLIWLGLVWFIPYILRGGKLSKITLAFLAFVFVAIIATIGSIFINLPTFKDVSYLSRDFQALLTLAVGFAFYYVISTWPSDEARLRLTLQMMNWSGLVMMIWSLLQEFFWFRIDSIPQFMEQIQSLLSLQGFYYHRATGFALEPSWHANQLNLLYLPFWLAASLQRTSVHRFRFIGISFENLLLIMGGVIVFLSSRIGLLALLFIAAYLLISGTFTLVRRIQSRLATHLTPQAIGSWIFRMLLPVGLVVVFFVSYIAASVGLVYAASHYDYRLKGLFNPGTYAIIPYYAGSYQIANRLAFAERVVFWDVGWEVFNDHPFLGVGLGNSGYYFLDKMPGYGWALTEVNTVMYRSTVIPNTKSIWTRILSETGLVGFAFWLAWLYLVWQAAHFIRGMEKPIFKTIGWAGAFTIIALLAEGFSTDTFALPYLWFSLGLVTAASRVPALQHTDKIIVET